MKKKFTSMVCGIAAASILSLALTACDSDSPSGPTGGDEKSSSVENTEPSSSSNGVVPPQSSSEVESSSSEAVKPDCDSTDTNCPTLLSSSSEVVSSSSEKQPETCRHITDVDAMTATGNCNSDTDQDAVEDCVTGKGFRCVMNYWTEIDICPPGSKCLGEKIVEEATDVSAMGRGGPAVAPHVVKVLNASGNVTFRDDGILVDDRCTFNGLKAYLSGDTLYATIEYPGCTTTGGSMGVITFTLSSDFADAKYIKYEDSKNAKKIQETDELLPCGNTSSCEACREGAAC